MTKRTAGKTKAKVEDPESSPENHLDEEPVGKRSSRKRTSDPPTEAKAEPKRAKKDVEDVHSPIPAADSSPASDETKDLWKEYMDQADVETTRLGLKGLLPVRGLPGSEDDDEEDDDGEREVSPEDISNLRFIGITVAREDELESTRKVILGDQCDEDILMLNTKDSLIPLEEIPVELKKIKQLALPAQFNRLLGITFNAKEFPSWYLDTEGPDDVAKVLKQLATVWKGLLGHSDEELGIDAVFTRPGIVALLEDLQNDVESYPDAEYRFKFQ